MPSHKLVLGGVVATGTAVTAGVGGMYLFKSDDKYIYELIKEDATLELLTSKDVADDNWKAAWEKYRIENQSATQDPWGISNWSTIKGKSGQNVPKDFLTKCESNSKKRAKNNKDSFYVQVAKWCARDKRVEAASLLDSDNRELLTASTQDSDKHWKAGWDAYRKDYKDTNLNPWGIKGWNSKKGSDGQNAPSDFISRCATEAKALVLNKEDQEYKNLFRYCSKVKG